MARYSSGSLATGKKQFAKMVLSMIVYIYILNHKILSKVIEVATIFAETFLHELNFHCS